MTYRYVNRPNADEQRRVDRWHATYNAALTGLRAWSSVGTDHLNVEAAHREATASADLAHGKLAPKERKET